MKKKPAKSKPQEPALPPAKGCRRDASCSPLWGTFNVNNYVRVKLTPRGRIIYEQELRSLMRGSSVWEYTPPKEDAEGWSEWQMWSLMSWFGPHISMGNMPPFETDIQIKGMANKLLSDSHEIHR